MDDRFELFFRGELPGVLKAAPTPAEPRPAPRRPRETAATGVPVTAGPLPQPVDAGGSQAHSADGAWAQAGAGGAALWVRSYLERLPAYAQVRHQLHDAALTHGVEPELLQALIATESGFDARAMSPKGAIGLMQVMPDTAIRFGLGGDNRATVERKLLDPATNLTTGLRYLRFLMNLFAGRLELVLAAYNAGEGAVQRAGNAIPNYRETLNYVRTVMQLYT
ncbi:MAG: lytic transglycosylase domain-containing protein, partial [Rhodoferax sp.]|nr:lytic transglycosylase domain-containing protein [Rhodoferax sp.]